MWRGSYSARLPAASSLKSGFTGMRWACFGRSAQSQAPACDFWTALICRFVIPAGGSGLGVPGRARGQGTTGVTDLRDPGDDDTGTGCRLESRAARDRGRTSYLRCSSRALGAVAIPAAELLHPAGGVEDARLPGVERVARRRDLDVDDGIGIAVLPGDGLPAGRSRPGEEGEVRRAVAENDRTIVRVDFLLHDYRSSRNSTWRPITGSYLRMTRRSGSFLRLFLVTYV